MTDPARTDNAIALRSSVDDQYKTPRLPYPDLWSLSYDVPLLNPSSTYRLTGEQGRNRAPASSNLD